MLRAGSHSLRLHRPARQVPRLLVHRIDEQHSALLIVLNLSGEGAVSDYRKLLQGFIWSERGHARDLTGFLLANGLLTAADLNEARLVAEQNERDGVCETVRLRLRYRPKYK